MSHKIDILEVSQFDGPGPYQLQYNIYTIDDLKNIRIRKIDPNENPSIGYVWYIKNKDDTIEIYKYNYDSSD